MKNLYNILFKGYHHQLGVDHSRTRHLGKVKLRMVSLVGVQILNTKYSPKALASGNACLQAIEPVAITAFLYWSIFSD